MLCYLLRKGLSVLSNVGYNYKDPKDGVKYDRELSEAETFSLVHSKGVALA